MRVVEQRDAARAEDRTVAALYVETDGCYFGLPGVEPWDEKRDARLYAGPHVVVAHPPCSSWCQLAHINQARWGRRVGDDGGCFAAALASVRQWGGVLEHPAASYAWPAFGLPRPAVQGWTRDLISGEWVCEVSQCAYGHPARKLTWLLYVGDAAPPAMDWSRPPPTHQVSKCANHGNSRLPRITNRVAAASPPAFRDLLLSIARSCRGRLPARHHDQMGRGLAGGGGAKARPREEATEKSSIE